MPCVICTIRGAVTWAVSFFICLCDFVYVCMFQNPKQIVNIPTTNGKCLVQSRKMGMKYNMRQYLSQNTLPEIAIIR